jgi:SWI/SNF-related matrix-associated actin-dependent regulator of chromatin subfamily D
MSVSLFPPNYPLTHVQWQKPTAYTDQDGFTITRRLDHTTTARIALHVAQQPEKYKFQPPLADVLQMNEGSRAAAVAALWNYIKVNQLQDKADRRAVRCDAKLQLVGLSHEDVECELMGIP